MDSEDTHTCGQCQHTFTALEDFARHKYTEHGMRFSLAKCGGKKPQIYYPKLVPVPGNRRPVGDQVKEVKLVNRRKRKTFVAQMVEMEGQQQAVINSDHQCNFCSRHFRTDKSLQDHKKNTHQVYRCALCPEHEQCDLVGEEAFDQHTMAHYWKRPCDQCDKRYSTIEGLEYHKKSMHKWVKKPKIDMYDPEKQFPCGKCRKRYIDDKHLQDHMRRMHDWKKSTGFPDDEQQEGGTCAQDTSGTQVPNPEEPGEVPGEAPSNQSTDAVTKEPEMLPAVHLSCYVCEEVIHDVVVFVHHLLSKHITATPHRCGTCEFSTANRALLAEHMLSEHNKHLPKNSRLEGIIIKDVESNDESDATSKQTEEQTNENESVPKAFILIDPKDNKTQKGDTQDTEKEHEELMKDLIVAASVSTDSSENTEADQSGGDQREQLSDADISKEKDLLQALDQLTAVQTVFCNEEPPAQAPVPEPTQPGLDQKDPLRFCKICGRSFITKAHLKVHTRKHTGERPFCCETCNRWFITKDSLNKHSVGHSDERRFKCGECGKLFKRMSHIRVHLEHTHSIDKPHVCVICDKYFKTMNSLRVHNKFSHTDERPHACTTCNKTFKTGCSLERHKLSHGERQYECDDCGRAFSYRSVLVQHKKSKVPCTMKPLVNSKSKPAASETQSSKDSRPVTIDTRINPPAAEMQHIPLPPISGTQHANVDSRPVKLETRINAPMSETQSTSEDSGPVKMETRINPPETSEMQHTLPPTLGMQHTNQDSGTVADQVSCNIVQQDSMDGNLRINPASSEVQHSLASATSEVQQALMDLRAVSEGVIPSMVQNS